MNLGENIQAAFHIVDKTYENVHKLIEYCKNIVSEKGEFELSYPKFLRWRSDPRPSGWYISSFILIFQHTKDAPLESGWRKGPLYILEINLYDPAYYDMPILNLAKYQCEGIENWGEGGVSQADHWKLYAPLIGENMNYTEDGNEYDGKVIDTALADKSHWGVRRIVGKTVPLTDITNDNAYDIIFGTFHGLAER